MGDRYILTVKCECGYIDEGVWYAPTCGVITWKCPKCSKIIDLEEYSGIDAEGCATTKSGVQSIRKLKKDIRKNNKNKGVNNNGKRS